MFKNKFIYLISLNLIYITPKFHFVKFTICSYHELLKKLNISRNKLHNIIKTLKHIIFSTNRKSLFMVDEKNYF